MSHCTHCGGAHIPDTDNALSCINCGRPAVAIVVPADLVKRAVNQEHYDPGLTKQRPRVGLAGSNIVHGRALKL